ncbi:MAG: MopE-related protein, partial [Candidatus Uhrbacteria bacterium]
MVQRLRATSASLSVFVLAFVAACSADFGASSGYLPCDADGACLEGYTCTTLSGLGAVCLDEQQRQAFCGKPDVCNGIDDDCDGSTDEDIADAVTGVDEGECQRGVTRCLNGVPTLVQREIVASADACNGLDDDCDGVTDEDFPSLGQSCSAGIGACVTSGMVVCDPNFSPSSEGEQEGVGVICSATAGVPTDELCNGLDDDCDGETDEELGIIATGTDDGECQRGIVQCVDGVSTVVQYEVGPSEESCNGLDDDCDGPTDEGAEIRAYGTAQGECEVTIETCTQGEYVVTSPGIEPSDELCDGLDNDCDGVTDNGFADLGQPCAVGTGACLANGTTVCAADGLATTCGAVAGTPSVELCDGVDNNCDGATDETFAEVGQTCSVGTGACRAEGRLVCRDDSFGTRCSAEAGVPSVEVCDGLDNNCNGEIDDGLGDGCCLPGSSRDCGINLGVCTVGQQACSDGRAWQDCSGRGPSAETCDGTDQDCNGLTDDTPAGCACVNGTTQTCSVTRGVCRAGVQRCNNGAWSVCDGVLPTPETCNILDDDCDGATDEDFPGLGNDCGVGRGICARVGTVICSADGRATLCSAVPGDATDEICNGLDDDCDGAADEGLVQIVGSDTGECQQGVKRCDGGVFVPVQELIESSDELCDGLDNDCDGAIDEDAPECCLPGATRTCGLHRGQCTIGIQTCDEDRVWGECTGILPSDELCNGLDDDCDGRTDEEWTSLIGQPCTVGRGVCARIGTWACDPNSGGDNTDSPPLPEGEPDSHFSPSSEGEREGVVCSATAGDPTDELCNGLDDDCDGEIDEDFADLGQPCAVGLGICVRTGTWVCDAEVGEGVMCSTAPGDSTNEVCDGRDNNCDGYIDNGIPSVPCYEGLAGTAGVGICREGATVCDRGTTRCLGQTLPVAEYCDGLDNDCDGATDGSLGAGGAPVPLTQPCYSGDPATLGIGECHVGTTTCSASRWGACVGEVLPSREICDTLDNDCDGETDEVDPLTRTITFDANGLAEIDTVRGNGYYGIIPAPPG